jgi:hypothetical protein
LDKLRLQKIELELMVRQFLDNNESFRRIKEFVRQTVEQSLVNQRHLLALALLSVIDSCRKDPVKFDIAYHNLPTSATTTRDTTSGI